MGSHFRGPFLGVPFWGRILGVPFWGPILGVPFWGRILGSHFGNPHKIIGSPTLGSLGFWWGPQRWVGTPILNYTVIAYAHVIGEINTY